MSRIAEFSAAAIEREGTAVSFQRSVPGVFTPSTGMSTAPTLTAASSFAFELEIDDAEDWTAAGEFTHRRKLLVSAPALDGFVPSPADSVEYAGETWVVPPMGSTPISLRRAAVLHEVRITR